MSEEKSVRQLERELKAARIREGTEAKKMATKSRDYSVGGIDKATTVEKKTPGASDIPDVILMPKKRKKQSENIPF
tara:strand:- start:711 stop:938 length:228 start_codon:yes stop_codon:yes gene_type:complete